MPWHIAKSGNGFKVITTATGKPHSNKPMSLPQAKKQLAALHIAMKEGKIK